MLRRIFKFHLYVLFCLTFNCSQFNNPIKPTHVIDCYYENNSYKAVIYPTNASIYCGTGLYKYAQLKDNITTLYIKTDADLSKEYSTLNEQNSNFIYKVILDSMYEKIGIDSSIIAVYRCKVILQSNTSNCYDTSYYDYYDKYEIIFNLNNKLMNYSKQFHWQARIFKSDVIVSDIITLPPKPYVYIASNSDIKTYN